MSMAAGEVLVSCKGQLQLQPSTPTPILPQNTSVTSNPQVSLSEWQCPVPCTQSAQWNRQPVTTWKGRSVASYCIKAPWCNEAKRPFQTTAARKPSSQLDDLVSNVRDRREAEQGHCEMSVPSPFRWDDLNILNGSVPLAESFVFMSWSQWPSAASMRHSITPDPPTTSETSDCIGMQNRWHDMRRLDRSCCLMG